MSSRRAHVCGLLIAIERSQRKPIGRQLEDQLRDVIRSGYLTGGTRLPSTRTLAEDLGVSRSIVVRAYAQLAAEAYIDVRHGANAVVRSTPPNTRTAVALHPRRERKPRFDLRPDMPALAAFPRSQWLRSLRHAVTIATDAELGYLDPRGLQLLRDELAAYLGRSRGVSADPDSVLVAAGSAHSVSLICRVLAQRGLDKVGLEDPSRRFLHDVVKRAGLDPVGVEVDEEGIVVEKLVNAGVRAVVVSPASQFPLGCELSGERRTQLVRWARESGGVIVEDDEAEFRCGRATAGALQRLAAEHVAYIGSTSKTLAPALRLGWVVLPPRLLAPVTQEVAHTVRQVSGIDQLAFTDFLRRGEFDRHLRTMAALYGRRRDALVSALRRQFPHFRTWVPAAGLHVVLEMPSLAAETAIHREAAKRKLGVQAISEHSFAGYCGPCGLLIGYGRLSEETIPDVIAELADVVATADRAAHLTLLTDRAAEAC